MGNRLPDTIASSIPIIQIRPTCIIEYYEALVQGRGGAYHDHISEANEAKEEGYGGKLTPAAAKRLKRAVNLLIMSSVKQWIYNPCIQQYHHFQLGFLTLTVSSKFTYLTAQEAYDRLLKHFLQWLRRTKKCNSYVWKAELQKRGQIHYHLTLGTFILHDEIRKKWNELQKREGLLQDYYDEHGSWEPNSIDIHSVITVKDVAAYICKYVAKEQDTDPVMKADSTNDSPITEAERWGNLLSCYPVNHVHTVRTVGKIWDCSTNLKKRKYWDTIMEPMHMHVLQVAKEQGLTKVIEGDRWKIHLMKDQNPLDILTDSERKRYDEYMKLIREDAE